jgi:hypothetical protein
MIRNDNSIGCPQGTGRPSLLLVELTPEIDPPLMLILADSGNRPGDPSVQSIDL